MQVTYPPVFQFDTGIYEATDQARLAEERRAAAQTRSRGGQRLSLGLALLRGRSAEPEQAAG